MDKQRKPRASSIPILEDLRAGLTNVDIATRHGVPPYRVANLRLAYRIGPATAPNPKVGAALADLRAGLRYREIAGRHSIGIARVRELARIHGLERNQHGSRPVDQRILDDLQAGMIYREVAAKHGLTFAQVRRIAGKANIRRTRGGCRPRIYGKPPPPVRR